MSAGTVYEGLGGWWCCDARKRNKNRYPCSAIADATNALVAKIEVVGYVVEMDLSRSEFLRI